MFSDPSRFDLR